MKNLGDKLREARESLGITIRDAAESTKLRVDVIENMESGCFDFDLPEIYKRGFLRIYTAFLKLDTSAAMAEYSEMASRSGRIHSADVKGTHDVIARAQLRQAPYQIEDRYGEDSESSASEEVSSEKAGRESIPQYVKLGGVFVGVLLLAVILVLGLSSLLRSSDAPEENSDIAMGAPVSQPVVNNQAEAIPQVPASVELNLVVTALFDTYILAYEESDPTHPLFSGSLEAGQKKEFVSSNSIMLKVTDAEKITLTKNGTPVNLQGAKGLKLFKIKAK